MRTVICRSQPTKQCGSRNWPIFCMAWMKTSCASSVASFGIAQTGQRDGVDGRVEALDEFAERGAVAGLSACDQNVKISSQVMMVDS